MKRMLRLKLCSAAGIALAFLAGACTSLQDDTYARTIAAEQVQQATVSYEETLVQLDAEIIGQGMNQVRALRLKEFLDNVDMQLKSGTDRGFEARMTALAGRAELLGGNTTRARKLYESAAKAQAGDTQVHVLAIRLADKKEVGSVIENSLAVADDIRPLHIEQALVLYEQGEFSRSAAAFDAAFRELPEYYQSAYQSVRDTAWRLKDSGGSSNVTVLTKEKISPADALSIAQSETALLEPWNGGKTLRTNDLFKKLSADGIVGKGFLSREFIRRIDCAQLLWNLYARARGITADYAAEFKAAGIAESPIADVAIDDDGFTAAAGVVENEIMPLTDGVHFEPQGTVRGTDFSGWAKAAGK